MSGSRSCVCCLICELRISGKVGLGGALSSPASSELAVVGANVVVALLLLAVVVLFRIARKPARNIFPLSCFHPVRRCCRCS